MRITPPFFAIKNLPFFPANFTKRHLSPTRYDDKAYQYPFTLSVIINNNISST
ncbi:MAG: hypothetical protein ACI9FJ_000524, partial [Alteromonadaceae bacterium]